MPKCSEKCRRHSPLGSKAGESFLSFCLSNKDARRRRLLNAWAAMSRLFACSTLLEAGLRAWATGSSNTGLALAQLAAAGFMMDPQQPRFLPALGVVLWKTYLFMDLWSLVFVYRVVSVAAALLILDLAPRDGMWTSRAKLVARYVLYSSAGAFVLTESFDSDDVLLGVSGAALGLAVGNRSESVLLAGLLTFQVYAWWLLEAPAMELEQTFTIAGGLMALIGHNQFDEYQT